MKTWNAWMSMVLTDGKHVSGFKCMICWPDDPFFEMEIVANILTVRGKEKRDIVMSIGAIAFEEAIERPQNAQERLPVGFRDRAREDETSGMRRGSQDIGGSKGSRASRKKERMGP